MLYMQSLYIKLDMTPHVVYIQLHVAPYEFVHSFEYYNHTYTHICLHSAGDCTMCVCCIELNM